MGGGEGREGSFDGGGEFMLFFWGGFYFFAFSLGSINQPINQSIQAWAQTRNTTQSIWDKGRCRWEF